MIDLLEREAPPLPPLTSNAPQNDTPPLAIEDFEAGILSHLDSLSKTAWRLTRNTQDAEDLVQDALLQAWRSAHTYRQGTNLHAWLFRVLMTTAINRYRKKARQPISVSFPDGGDITSFINEISKVCEQDFQPGAEEEVISRYLDEDVDLALTKLRPSYRQVILLADIVELPYKEIANILQIPIGTVMSRISRGRHILQHSLLGYAQKHGYVA